MATTTHLTKPLTASTTPPAPSTTKKRSRDQADGSADNYPGLMALFDQADREEREWKARLATTYHDDDDDDDLPTVVLPPSLQPPPSKTQQALSSVVPPTALPPTKKTLPTPAPTAKGATIEAAANLADQMNAGNAVNPSVKPKPSVKTTTTVPPPLPPKPSAAKPKLPAKPTKTTKPSTKKRKIVRQKGKQKESSIKETSPTTQTAAPPSHDPSYLKAFGLAKSISSQEERMKALETRLVVTGQDAFLPMIGGMIALQSSGPSTNRHAVMTLLQDVRNRAVSTFAGEFDGILTNLMESKSS